MGAFSGARRIKANLKSGRSIQQGPAASPTTAATTPPSTATSRNRSVIPTVVLEDP